MHQLCVGYQVPTADARLNSSFICRHWGEIMLARILSLVVSLHAFSIATASLAIAWGEEHDVRVVDPVDRCRVVAAKADAQGTIHLLYDRDDGPQYVKSIDRGQSLSAAMPIINACRNLQNWCSRAKTLP